MVQIKNRFSGRVICEGEYSDEKLLLDNKADLREADLRWANLREANLREANLQEADLREADLRWANLQEANLREANLREANLQEANLQEADLREADLWRANLREANLQEADLRNARNVIFYFFPSIRTLSRINLGTLPDDLTLELMRRDAASHPHPERFNEWAKGSSCPYQSEDAFWLFKPKKKLWRKGQPKMSDVDLIKALCKACGWKIRGYEL